MPDIDNIPIEIAKEVLGSDAETYEIAMEGADTLSLTHCKTRKNQNIALPVRSGAILDAALALAEEKGPEITYIIGDWLYISGKKTLSPAQKGAEKDLTDKEVDILEALIQCQNGMCFRQDLLENVWGYKTELETHTLETHIYRLRQKIEQDPNDPKVLLTAESGYKLNFSVKN